MSEPRRPESFPQCPDTVLRFSVQRMAESIWIIRSSNGGFIAKCNTKPMATTESEQMATTTQAQPELLTKRQAEELLQCSTRQIELLVHRGRIARLTSQSG